MTNIKAVDVSEIEKLVFRNVHNAEIISARELREYLDCSPSVSAPTMPEGYALVPIEPTEEMLEAGYNAGYLGGHEGDEWVYASPMKTYKAMLSANQGSDKDGN